MDILTIKLLFLFFPGIIGVILVNYALGRDKKLDIGEGIAYSFILGTLSYLYSYIFNITDIFSILNNENLYLSGTDIFKTLGISILLSFLVITIINNEIYHHLLRKLKISNTLGKKYILHNVYSTKDSQYNDLKNHWVCIRYQNKELVYNGYIQAIDILETSYIEILLREVQVTYDNKDNPSYKLTAIYICEKPENIVIEYLPNI